MDEADRSPQIVRFGIFEADLQTGELRKKGIRVRLQGQPFQVCAILLQHSGELVTREELRQKVWPEDTFVDFEHALNTAIAKIRIALGDDAENPRFVETLPRRGYRFIGPVDKPSSPAPSLNGAEPTPVTVTSDDRQDSAITNQAEQRKLESELLLAFHYMRGQAHLLAHHGKEAAEEFQKIIDHRGIVPNVLLCVLAHLGLARASALDGDTGKSRAEYEEFFGFWEEGDSKVPIVQQAKMEYARLR